MGVSNFTGPRESKLTIPRARKMAKHSKIPRIVNEIPGNLRANSQEKAVELERKTKKQLTKIVDAETSLVQSSRIELKTDDGKNQNGKHDKETDLHKWRQSLENGLEHHLKT